MLHTQESVLASLWREPSYEMRMIFADWFDDVGSPDIGIALRYGHLKSRTYCESIGRDFHSPLLAGNEFREGRYGDGHSYGQADRNGYGDGYATGYTAVNGYTYGYGCGYNNGKIDKVAGEPQPIKEFIMEVGMRVFIFAGQGFAFVGDIVAALPPFGVILGSPTMVCRTNGIPWDDLCRGIGRDVAIFRRFDRNMSFPNIVGSADWAGEIPESSPRT